MWFTTLGANSFPLTWACSPIPIAHFPGLFIFCFWNIYCLKRPKERDKRKNISWIDFSIFFSLVIPWIPISCWISSLSVPKYIIKDFRSKTQVAHWFLSFESHHFKTGKYPLTNGNEAINSNDFPSPRYQRAFLIRQENFISKNN